MKTWGERAKAVFAQGGNTYSKLSSQYVEGVYPTHVIPIPNTGCEIYGLESGGHCFDFVCGLGSNLIDIRNNFSLPTIHEVVLAERIKTLFPCIDKLKLVKTGSAACSAAVRIARAYTSKSLVFGTGYHGTDNWAISAEDPGTGTVFEFYQKFRDFDNLILNLQKAEAGSLAAVIIEPVQLDFGKHIAAQLEEIRRLCTEKKAILIFDEVITGFRFLDYSVSNHLGVRPDLICLGKALGNGYPIALVGGREEIVETPGYFISNTHNGELSAISAALDTLDYLNPMKLRELWALGTAFQLTFNSFSPKLQIIGYGTRGELQGEEMFKALFMQEMVKRGYFFGSAWFITFAHHPSVLNNTLDVAREVVSAIEAGKVKLEGELPRPVFRRNP